MSIECFNKSLEVFDRDKFPQQWQIDREDLSQSQQALAVESQNRSESQAVQIV
jgi:hypothetical protein